MRSSLARTQAAPPPFRRTLALPALAAVRRSLASSAMSGPPTSDALLEAQVAVDLHRDSRIWGAAGARLRRPQSAAHRRKQPRSRRQRQCVGGCFRTSAARRLGWALTTASISAWSQSQELNGRAASITGPARSARHLSPQIQRRARPSSAPSRYAGTTIAEPCWCSSQPLWTTVRDAHMPWRARGPDGDRQAVASRPRSRIRRRSAPALDGRSRPTGPPTAKENVPALAGQLASVHGERRSRSPRPPNSGTNQGALFRLTGNRPWPHCGPTEHLDRADPPAATS